MRGGINPVLPLIGKIIRDDQSIYKDLQQSANTENNLKHLKSNLLSSECSGMLGCWGNLDRAIERWTACCANQITGTAWCGSDSKTHHSKRINLLWVSKLSYNTSYKCSLSEKISKFVQMRNRSIYSVLCIGFYSSRNVGGSPHQHSRGGTGSKFGGLGLQRKMDQSTRHQNDARHNQCSHLEYVWAAVFQSKLGRIKPG